METINCKRELVEEARACPICGRAPILEMVVKQRKDMSLSFTNFSLSCQQCELGIEAETIAEAVAYWNELEDWVVFLMRKILAALPI